jgi:hypothetical protein
MTNREWLDEMSDEELGEFLENVACGYYQIGDWGYWLSLERPEQESRP